jgi:hypothetical protein
MNFECIMLKEINQLQKDKYYMTPFQQSTQNRQIHGDERKTVITRAWSRVLRGEWAVGTELLFGMRKKFWK